jgi:hypothetical protein
VLYVSICILVVNMPSSVVDQDELFKRDPGIF